jgi:hypothetical protein
LHRRATAGFPRQMHGRFPAISLPARGLAVTTLAPRSHWPAPLRNVRRDRSHGECRSVRAKAGAARTSAVRPWARPHAHARAHVSPESEVHFSRPARGRALPARGLAPRGLAPWARGLAPWAEDRLPWDCPRTPWSCPPALADRPAADRALLPRHATPPCAPAAVAGFLSRDLLPSDCLSSRGSCTTRRTVGRA